MRRFLLLIALLLMVPLTIFSASLTMSVQPGDTLVVRHPDDCTINALAGGHSISCPALLPTVTVPQPTPTAVAVAGQPCPEWVHANYVTTGPDGLAYPTWHPPTDLTTGCRFSHEHGSNPARFIALTGYKAPFGYVNHHGMMEEHHNGFKNFLLDDNAGHLWLLTPHLGTGNTTRQCVRFHAMSIAIADKATGELLARVHFMGDWGASYIQALRAQGLEKAATHPAACPNQFNEAQADRSGGSRNLPVNVQSSGLPNGDTSYEPWLIDTSRTIVGLRARGLSFNTVAAMFRCATVACSTMEPRTNSTGLYGKNNGAYRHMSFSTLGFTAPAEAGIFTTDHLGRVRGGMVEQYVKPGLIFTVPALGFENGNNEEYQPQDDGQNAINGGNGGMFYVRSGDLDFDRGRYTFDQYQQFRPNN